MSKDFKQLIAEVKEAYDLADYIESTGVSLKSVGSKHKGLCPFHHENTPSMTVDSGFQSYHCFGCGAHGDLISFVQESESLSFWDALSTLAEAKGIDVSEVLSHGQKGEEFTENLSELREIVRTTANFFWTHYAKLPDSHPGKKEILKRKLSTENTYNYYGYAPEGKNHLYQFLKKKNFSDDSIAKTGVCRSGEYGFYDAWQGRLMFLISDITGRPVGFSGRKLYSSDKMGKYVNSIDSPVFNKSKALFNINNAKKAARDTSEMYVAEGQFDVSAIIASRHTNVVASSGTAFTQLQSSQLRRLVGDNGKIIFVFDPDEAGKNAVRKIFETDTMIHGSGFVVSLPGGHDPDEFAQKNGHHALGEYISNPSHRQSIIGFVLDHEKSKVNISTPEGKSAYLKESTDILSKVDNEVLRREYMKIVSLDTGGIGVDKISRLVAEKIQYAKIKSNNSPSSDAQEKTAQNRSTSDEISTEGNTTDNGSQLVSGQPRRSLPDSDASDASDQQGASLSAIEGIGESMYKSMLCRFIWAVCARRELGLDKLIAIKKSLAPKSFHGLIEELRHYPINKPIIFEKFTHSDLLKYIIENHKPSEYFVVSDDEMVKSFLDITIQNLAMIYVKHRTQNNRSHMVSLLGGDNVSHEVFRRVIEEQRKTQKNVEYFLESMGV